MRAVVPALLSLCASAVGADEYRESVLPVLQKHCLGCHSTEKQKGDLDLERFQSAELVRRYPDAWEHVLEQLANNEMPPKKEPQMPAEQKTMLMKWVETTLDEAARVIAGDPGPVVLRRLSNMEYTYTLRDLTGVPSLDPAKEFPVDGAAGEGFTNAGAALVMSPALLTKYLDAAKEVASHAVLTPTGIRFSAGTSSRDWTDETLAKIRAFYDLYTGTGSESQTTQQGIQLAMGTSGGRLPLAKYLAALQGKGPAEGLSAKYLALLRAALTDTKPSPLLDGLREKFRAGTLTVADIEPRQQSLWRFASVGQIGKKNGPKSWQEPVTPPGALHDEAAFDDFRALFPIALCYSKIVPVDEVVTLTLFHREDDPLKRLMLDDAQIRALDQLWDELRFVSESPLKQVDVFEQLYQFATQDRPDLVVALEPMREPIMRGAEAFKKLQVEVEPKHVQAVLDFAQRAWRRALTGTEQDELRTLYQTLRKQELPHASAVRMLLARVLVAPAFLYRGEKPAPGPKAAPVNDAELATRLSYFLWSSAPDDELRDLAASGRLHDPDVLATQARRMMKHVNVRRLATEFGCQWLQIRDLATLGEKSERHFPTFLALRGAMQEEAVRFFVDLFQEDRSVLSLLDADYSFMNRDLARHYGIEKSSDDWQRVDALHAHGRGGLLAFAATLAKQSGASRTSPILRGNWLSEVVLGERMPRPPKNVPVLPAETPPGLSERQIIERHGSDPACMKCHQRIDPFGFALEGFDAIGRARGKDAAGMDVDTKAVLPDGTEIEGLVGLRTYLLTRRTDDFLRQFNRKLLGYALGRSVQLSDKPLLDTMLIQLKANHHQAGTVIELIVRSPQFREVRGRDFKVN